MTGYTCELEGSPSRHKAPWRAAWRIMNTVLPSGVDTPPMQKYTESKHALGIYMNQRGPFKRF